MVGPKHNFRNPQKAIEYALCQAIGSHFKNSGSINKINRQTVNRKIAYGEESRKNCEILDSACASFFKKEVAIKAPKGFWNEEIEVIYNLRKDGIAEILFVGERTILCVAGIWERSGHHRFFGPEFYRKNS